jgi:hypothetical protein
MGRCVAVCAIVVLFAGGYHVSIAQSITPLSAEPCRNGQYYSLGIQKFVNSFTSYQFPNPFPPDQDPLSRLEFPIDQWFMGIFSGFSSPAWILSGQLWLNLNREGSKQMQDSDWDDDSMPSQKTIFSESRCRLNRGVLVDVALSLATPFSGSSGIWPVLGGRYQYFSFTTHDGVQMELNGPTMDLPGEGIDFKQTFYHLYFGGTFSRAFVLTGISASLPPVAIGAQVDYALVNAKNEDLHLLRSGNRITQENTRGHCWHVAAWLDFFLRNSFKAKVSADFKRVITDGGHRLTNSVVGLDFSFDGSRVWSDQATISAIGELTF